MTQVDHIFAISMTLVVVSFLIFYVSSDFETKSVDIKKIEIKQSADLLLDQIDYALENDIHKFSVMFTEIGDMTHSEDLTITIRTLSISPKPIPIQPRGSPIERLGADLSALDDVKLELNKVEIDTNPGPGKFFIYDSYGNRVDATVHKALDMTNLVLPLGFTPGEKKLVDFYHTGGRSGSITYASIPAEVNVTAKIVSSTTEKYTAQVNLEQDYVTVREVLGFNNFFKIKIGEAVIGPEPPIDTNVIVSKKTFFVESGDELKKQTAEVSVW